MPKATSYTLIWAGEGQLYELYGPGGDQARLLEGEPEWWFGWLADQVSFSFRGRLGHLTALKETRVRGGGYWYGYRSFGKRTVKAYLGPTKTLTLERLEAAAQKLAAQATVEKAIEQAPAPLLQEQQLLAPKLQAPRQPAGLVVRDRLLARLDAGLGHALTLVSAPAGFGKTTLVGQWGALQTGTPQVAWVTLDSGDNDPLRFWRYLVSASRVFRSDLGSAALAMLHPARFPSFPQSPFPLPSLEPVLTAFVNDLAHLNTPAVLVIDDYHMIGSVHIHEGVAFLLNHMPAALHLLLITRSDPPLPLAQLRARGALNEIRAGELRFSQAECRAFFAKALPFPITESALGQLEMRTEGWAAGLRLAAVALRQHSGPQAFAQALAAFSGSQQPIADYLAADVLQTQPVALQTFLLQTSILGRMNAALCDTITGRTDSAEVLEALERASLFVIALDEPGWYRYQALFAEAMRHEAARRLGAAEMRSWYGRASFWYEQQGMLHDAVDAALEAEAWERATACIERILEQQAIGLSQGPHGLRRWVERLPEEIADQYPSLCFAYAMALLHTSDRPMPARVALIETPLMLAERGWRREENEVRIGQLYAVRALCSLWTGQMNEAVRFSKQAVELLPPGDSMGRGIAQGFIGFDLLRNGQLHQARQTMFDALERSQASGSRPGARAHMLMLGDICAGQLELHQAAAFYRQALDDALDAYDRVDEGTAHAGLAQLAYEQDDLVTAEQEAQAALSIAQESRHELLAVRASLTLAWVVYARGELQSAQEVLAGLLAGLQPQRMPLLYREVYAAQTRLLLVSGNLAAAERWLSERLVYATPLMGLLQEQEELVVARLMIGQGNTDAALEILVRQRSAALAGGRARVALQILVLTALAQAAQNEAAAQQTLRQALEQGYAAGMRRLFLDEGQTLAGLLRSVVPILETQALRNYAQSLVQALVLEQASMPLAALSRQEQQVLKLLAAGRSNPEIAQELVVSLNTIKTHLKHIYSKLGVRSRQEASAVAQRLGLL